MIIPQRILYFSLWLVALSTGQVSVDPNPGVVESKGKYMTWALVLLCLLSDEVTLCIRMLEMYLSK